MTGLDSIDNMPVGADIRGWKSGFEWCTRLGATF